MSDAQIKRVGMSEFKTVGDKTWKRRIGTDNWTLIESSPLGPPSEPPLQFILVREFQAEGEPHHWSLFVGQEGQRGNAYQVRGDMTSMSHSHEENVNVLDLESYMDSFVLAYVSQAQAGWIHECANTEPAPCAPDQASANENCQGWAIRVVQKAVERGLVEETWLASIKQLQQPVK